MPAKLMHGSLRRWREKQSLIPTPHRHEGWAWTFRGQTHAIARKRRRSHLEDDPAA